MTTELLDQTEILAAQPANGRLAACPDGEIDHEWLEFLSLGLRLEQTSAVGANRWRSTPVLLSY